MYNKVILMGRICRDPELKTTQSGVSMCRFTIAVDRQFQKQGEERQADFFDVTAWRQTAEFVCKWFSKGKMILIDGKLQNDNYTDQNGNKVYRNSIIADNVSFCGDKSGSTQAGSTEPSQTRQNATQRPAQHKPTPQTPDVELGDLSEFEEILSDGAVPF